MNSRQDSSVVRLHAPWLALIIGVILAAQPAGAAPAPAPGCPPFGWAEGLGQYLASDAPFPTQDTANNPPDCRFHEWSWEAFVWATALDSNGVPRFLSLATEDELLGAEAGASAPRPRDLRLAARSLAVHGTPGYTEGAGAIVEADGNVLVAPNGYPVYASIHMNPSYFDTVKENLIVDGGYTNQPANAYFDLGAAVFKATWLRLDAGEKPPAAAYTTQAQVPVLTQSKSTTAAGTTITIFPVSGQFTNVTVALVGLHVVGYTVDHPEFLWATFEHNLNAPAVPDGTFTTNQSNPHGFTFYQANTSFAQVNQAEVPPQLTFDPTTQRFAPANNVVQQNRTGGENHPHGPGNIAALNQQAGEYLAGLKSSQSLFSSYRLVGTVWTAPNTYTEANSTIGEPFGSVSLANTTAETFVQFPNFNCFGCHSQASYSPPRRIGISHAVAVGSSEAVANQVSGTFPATNAIGATLNRLLGGNK
ncbi:MAG: hypothetical protein H7A45_17740 [Verrucomicrobiales bacterium]|nr:hypothetical protein [Verrucomicrobiales bacterium]MCP5525399.1 hypothetical protein [Verrucomicrobiales bacterium]